MGEIEHSRVAWPGLLQADRLFKREALNDKSKSGLCVNIDNIVY